MDLSNKRVLITGASRGIGEALAGACASAGATVALAARNAGALSDLAARLGGAAYPIDLSDQTQVDGFIGRVEADGGPIDVLINNAAVESHLLFDHTDEAEIVRTIALNLTAPQRLSRQVLAGMIERGRGHIVNVSSMAGIGNVPTTTVYSSTKAGLSHFSGGLRADLKGTGIGVTLVELGPVDTDMLTSITASPAVDAAFRRMTRMGMLPTMAPEKLAGHVVGAIQEDRYHVRFPKRGVPLYMLEDAPRRMVAAILVGMKARP